MEDSAGAWGEVTRKLENIQAMTDEAFVHLNVEEFLDDLLERVRDVLAVDTAVVLLLDRWGRFLVATAAVGLEEEVTQAAHVPVGQGFAGRVAAERRPITIDEVTSADLFNPVLVRRGLRSLLGVPLVAGGTLLGVLHVGTFTPHRFTPDEIEFLQLAAARAATAVRSLLSRAERDGAMELQRGLVPAELPVVPGLELAACYRPGTATVGGDWYDVFALPSGEVGIVMGDVAGHGFSAAVMMERMRSALRAYALETTDPAEVLRKLDRQIRHFEPDATATVLYAMGDPAMDAVRVSSAGHWPPVLAPPGDSARVVEMTPDVLIGSGEDLPRTTTTFRLPPGALLCLYTDGLIERRDSSILDGISRLCDAVYAGPPETVSASVMATLIGREPAEDDIALLTLRRHLS